MKKLLNIDGGGVRVYFPLLILSYIEKKTNKKISEIFDYFSGVSASSLVLSAILTKYSVDEVIGLFKDITKIIFNKSYFYTITSGFGLVYSKYPDYYINLELEKHFTNTKLTDIKKLLSILTYDLANSKPICWHSYNDSHNYEIWKIIRGSTATPTYFPPFTLDTHLLIDGGVVTNNLSELIFSHALTHYGQDEEFFQISLGTGSYNPKLSYTPSGLLSWSGSIINVLFNASALYEMKTLKKLSKLGKLTHFYRLNIELDEDIMLDDHSSFDKMDNIFKKWLDNNKDFLDEICKELM